MKYNNVVFNIDDIFYKEEFQLFPQIKQVIQSLKARGIKLGIITSKTKEEYKKNFSKSEIESYFDLVIFAEDINNKQPIEKYLQLTKSKKEELIMKLLKVSSFQ